MLWGMLLLSILGTVCLSKVWHDQKKVDHLTPISVVLVWCFYALHSVLLAWAAWFSLWPLAFSGRVAFPLGLTLVVGGTFFYTMGMANFRSFKRMSGMDTTQLISGGIYRWSRNPQNLGWGLCLLGIALMGRSALALLLVLLFWIVFGLYVPLEEHYLERVYGEAYREYCRTVARYFRWPTKEGGDSARGG